MSVSIAVIIPTVGRKELYRSVASVLSQTRKPDEIIVCADTVKELDLPASSLIKVLRVGPGAGGNRARNAGAKAANSEVIALLDDDDYWLPTYLEKMLSKLNEEPRSRPWLLSCRVLNSAKQVYPRRVISAGDELITYLTALKGGVTGKGALMTPTLIFPRSMILEVPWDEHLKFHQDMTWIVALKKRFPDLEVIQSSSPLVVIADTPGSVSKSIPLAQSVDWAKNTLLESGLPGAKLAFGDFLLSRYPARAALSRREWRCAYEVFKLARREGSPSFWAVFYFAGYALRSFVKQPWRNSGASAL